MSHVHSSTMEEGTFNTLIPSRYISFTLPINSISCFSNYFYTDFIQISVLDSPQPPFNPPKVAALLVPKFRETDWIFATLSGHLQLLFSFPAFSRLILIGNAYDSDGKVGTLYRKPVEMNPFCKEELETGLYPLLSVLLPEEVGKLGGFELPFLSYEDDLVCSVIVEKCVGDFVGEMLVEDVEIVGCSREFRRRLRFKRMPNLVQTEICVVPSGDCLDIEKADFFPNLGVLVHPYLGPMVAGLALIGGCVQARLESGVRPRGFCLGVGGGALLSFLSVQLGFEVVGVEVDEVVLSVAKRYFGLQTGEGIQLCVGDGIEILKKLACVDYKSKPSSFVENIKDNKFDVIMVDLDSSDSKMGISAPTLEFMQKDVLLAAKSCLYEDGIMVLNVIPKVPEFYGLVKHELQEVFVDLHEIDVGNEENFVVIASKKLIDLDLGASENAFLSKLKSVISEVFIDAIRKV